MNTRFFLLTLALLTMPVIFASPSHADMVYVSTYNLNSILRFDSSGNQSTFAMAGSGLNYPLGLAVDQNGNLFVANSGGGLQGTSSIQEFTPSGSGSTLSISGLSFPSGLAFGGSGNLYVANAGNNTIEEFWPGGTASVFATSSSGIDFPEGLATDADGNLYVANSANVEKFAPNGVGTVFATTGLNNPQGLALDSSGNLYVANYGNNTILKFNASGQDSIFASFSTNGLAQYIQGPVGLAFSSSGDLYIANHFTDSILEIAPDGGMSLFASGLPNAGWLAIQMENIPEPSSLLLTAPASPPSRFAPSSNVRERDTRQVATQVF